MTNHRMTVLPQPIFSPRPAPVLTGPPPDPADPDVTIFSKRRKMVLTSPIPASHEVTTPTETPIPDAPDVSQVASLAAMIRGGRWRTEAMRAYTRPVLYWFTRGAGRATIAGATRGFAPHNAFLVPAGIMHGFDLIGSVSGSVVFLPRAMASDWPDAALRLPLRDGQAQMELTHLIDALREEGEGDDAWSHAAMAHRAGLLAIWLKRKSAQMAPIMRDDKAACDLSGAFAALVETDFGAGLGVADYAARLGVTPTHLSRVCRAASGRAAHDILKSRRLYEAQHLLADTDTAVADIALQSGFGSAAYFSRAFRKVTGFSPSAFRRDFSGKGTFPTP